MGKYVERNLNPKEQVLKNAELHPINLIIAWVFGILFFWLLLIPTIKAIKATIDYMNMELSVTDKRVIGKAGFVSSASLDAPLNKIQNVTVTSNLLGKMFNYGTIEVQTAGDAIAFAGIKDADKFKKFVMNQIEEYENAKIKAQAQELAAAMTANKE